MSFLGRVLIVSASSSVIGYTLFLGGYVWNNGKHLNPTESKKSTEFEKMKINCGEDNDMKILSKIYQLDDRPNYNEELFGTRSDYYDNHWL